MTAQIWCLWSQRLRRHHVEVATLTISWHCPFKLFYNTFQCLFYFIFVWIFLTHNSYLSVTSFYLFFIANWCFLNLSLCLCLAFPLYLCLSVGRGERTTLQPAQFESIYRRARDAPGGSGEGRGKKLNAKSLKISNARRNSWPYARENMYGQEFLNNVLIAACFFMFFLLSCFRFALESWIYRE